jgi:hypothetical protein
MAYTEFLGAQEAGKELLLYGVGNDALTPLKMLWQHNHSLKEILHLQEKMTIKITTSQKFEYKAEGYGRQCNLTTGITAYFTSLDKF